MRFTSPVHRSVFVMVICLIGYLIGIGAGHVYARSEQGPPTIMSYQGYLTDPEGKPLPDGQYDFTVSLYVGPASDTPIWEEQHNKITVRNGNVQLQLGNGTPSRPLDVPFDRPYFLGVRVGSDPEMVPRIELTTSPYSFRARYADEVPDSSITADKLAPLSVTDEKIKSVTWDKITGVPAADPAGKGGPGPVPASVWHIRGNLKTDPEKNFLGTADSTDLSIRTNGIEALRILANGEVLFHNKFTFNDYILSRKSATEGGFWLADSLHGLKRFGNDDVSLYTTGGSLLLEGGKVGIGTSSPYAGLHVNSGPESGHAFLVAVDRTPKLLVSQDGRVMVMGQGDGSDTDPLSYPFSVQSKNQGIHVHLWNGKANNSMNYMYFTDLFGAAGRIEGQTLNEYLSHPVTDATEIHEIALGVALGIAVGTLDAEGIVSLTATIALEEYLRDYNKDNVGVSYASGGADYAEWLPRLDEDEQIEAGDIVGVFGGKITRSTANAQQILAVSRNPIVLGNMPSEDQEHLYEKITFMGQVAVKVVGRVKTGDFIIPSGLADGTGIAVSPEMMTADEYAKVVGRAWSASDNEFVKLVNVAVGLNPGDVAALIKMQQAQLNALKAELATRDSDVRKVMAELDEIRTQLNALSDVDETTVQLRSQTEEADQSPDNQQVKDRAEIETPSAKMGQ